MVRIANELVPDGEIGAVMLMFPELFLSIDPILRTLAEILFSSSLVMDSFPMASVPRSISRALSLGVSVTGDVPPVTVTDEPTVRLSAIKVIPPKPEL
jgi:hypothetical protein